MIDILNNPHPKSNNDTTNVNNNNNNNNNINVESENNVHIREWKVAQERWGKRRMSELVNE